MHLAWVKDEETSNIVTYLDYWGIALSLLGGAYPYISYKYACGPFIVWRYVFTSIIAVLTVVAMWASVQKTLMSPKRRLILFLVFSASCMIPVMLLYFWNDPKYTLDFRFGPYWIPVGVQSLAAFFYIYRIPERWSSKGHFDFFGASHQIFHCLVLLAICLAYKEHLNLYEQRLAFTCPHDAAPVTVA